MSYNPFMYWAAGGPLLFRSRVIQYHRGHPDATPSSQSQSALKSRNANCLTSDSGCVHHDTRSDDNSVTDNKPKKSVHFEETKPFKSCLAANYKKEEPSKGWACDCVKSRIANPSEDREVNTGAKNTKVKRRNRRREKKGENHIEFNNCNRCRANSQSNQIIKATQQNRHYQSTDQSTPAGVLENTQKFSNNRNIWSTPVKPQIQQSFMSRIIQPSRAEVILREDVIECSTDPRPNAFFDSRSGILRVYHGSRYGNPYATLIPIPPSQVPVGAFPPNTAMFCGHAPVQAPAQPSSNVSKNQNKRVTKKKSDASEGQQNWTNNEWPTQTASDAPAVSDSWETQNNDGNQDSSTWNDTDNNTNQNGGADSGNNNNDDSWASIVEDDNNNNNDGTANSKDGDWNQSTFNQQSWADPSCAQSTQNNGYVGQGTLQSEVSAGSWGDGGTGPTPTGW
ncbi:hypothetical protein B7463_g9661, partial [Scytalidium lignicola]